MASASYELSATNPSTALEVFIKEQPEEDRKILDSIISLSDKRGLKSTNPKVLSQTCVAFCSHLIRRGYAPIMPQHHIERAQHSDPLPDLPSWAYDLRLLFHAPFCTSPDSAGQLDADVQADGSLIAELYYVGVVGEVNVTKSWFELLSASQNQTSQPESEENESQDDEFDDRFISIASSSVHTMDLLGGTSLLKPGDLMFSLRAKCFAEGGGLFFFRRAGRGTNRMKLVYSRSSGDVRRRGDKRNVDQRVVPREQMLRIQIC